MDHVTKQEIEVAKSKNGGWSKKQLETWGVPWPPPKGWKERVVDGRAFELLPE